MWSHNSRVIHKNIIKESESIYKQMSMDKVTKVWSWYSQFSAKLSAVFISVIYTQRGYITIHITFKVLYKFENIITLTDILNFSLTNHMCETIHTLCFSTPSFVSSRILSTSSTFRTSWIFFRASLPTFSPSITSKINVIIINTHLY